MSVDVDQVILCGTQLLEEVGDQMHPLASRYVQSFQQLQTRLRAISAARTQNGTKALSGSGLAERTTPSSPDVHAQSEYRSSDGGSNNTAFPNSSDPLDLPFPAPADSSMLLGGVDFSNIEDLLYTTDWTGLMADWNEA
jgi:hypothetical protein